MSIWLIIISTLLTLAVFCIKNFGYFIVNFRWFFAIFFLMPASLIYNIFYYVRSRLVFKLNTAPTRHHEKVLNVQRQVLEWNKSGKQTLMCTGRPGWKAMSIREARYKLIYTNIHVDLMDVLEVDAEKKSVRVEPLVSMGQVTTHLNSIGWTLPIVPELDDLTIGCGLVMGVGIESSSHKYGLMQHLLISAEIVLSDGSLIKCSQLENSDLFNALPWSHGTLGFLVAAELRIIPAKRYVRIHYKPVHSFKEIIETFTKESQNQKNDFVEGLVFSPNDAVIMTGTLTDSLGHDQLNEIGRYYKPWFYKHVETLLNNGPKVECIPLRQYYHRHTKGLFWQMQDIIPFGNNPIFRYIFGWMVPPKVSFLKLTQNKSIKDLYEKHQIIQDMLLPITTLPQALEFFQKELEIYPLWLCPFILFDGSGFVHPKTKEDQLYVDIGAYGAPKIKNYNSYEALRKLEKFVLCNNGFQMLYADSYLTREEFHQMFDHRQYEQMRAKYKCENAFPEVYDKVNRKARS
ncbi:hypothetical protein HELRODRAFT_88371 [Helobdella robusta]|uniref:Delta(24)-sterol reductase n=1 Tax=Helobdella robusta TaxID=6412 RepID=T1G718_HELRO|nr:hypothetical protein HELRODRAFT_88371 [Helobdella robusta]ESN93679.1 hypothetical protein HELRODRAFT_88371 [Helobdella robusta]